MNKKTKKAAKAASKPSTQAKKVRAAPVAGQGFTVLKPNEVELAGRPKRPSMFDPAVKEAAEAFAAGGADFTIGWNIPAGRAIDTYRTQIFNGMRRSLRAAGLPKATVSVRLAKSGTSFVVSITK